MKKYTALMLTFLLLITMVPPASVQAMPGKGRTATAGSGRGVEGGSEESYIRDGDRSRSSSRERRDTFGSTGGDRDRLRNRPIRDPYGSRQDIIQDPIHIAQDGPSTSASKQSDTDPDGDVSDAHLSDSKTGFYKSNFGDRLTKLKGDRDYSEFSQSLGLDLDTISSYIFGTSGRKLLPNYPTLKKIAERGGVSADYLFGRTNNPNPYPRSSTLGGKTFAQRLKLLRDKNNWTVKEIALKSGLLSRIIYVYLNGKSQPTGEPLLKLADLFDVPLDYLLGLTDIKVISKDSSRDPNIAPGGSTDGAGNRNSDNALGSITEEDIDNLMNIIRPEMPTDGAGNRNSDNATEGGSSESYGLQQDIIHDPIHIAQDGPSTSASKQSDIALDGDVSHTDLRNSKMDFYERSFKDRLTKLRGDRDYSEFSQSLGLSPETISNYILGISGRSLQNYPTLRKIAQRGGVSADYLFGRTNNPNPYPRSSTLGGETFAQRLKLLRDKNNWTVKEIALKLGLASRIIYKYLNGKSQPTGEPLLKLADSFNVPLDYLLGLTDVTVISKDSSGDPNIAPGGSTDGAGNRNSNDDLGEAANRNPDTDPDEDVSDAHLSDSKMGFYKSNFGDRLTKLKGDRNYSEFPQSLGLDLGTINSYIFGISGRKLLPNYPTLKKIAERGGVSADYLFGRTNNPNPYPRSSTLGGETFAQRLKLLKNEHHWSNGELARKSGMSRAFFSKCLNGKSQPTGGPLLKLADLFDVPLDYLLGLTDIKVISKE